MSQTRCLNSFHYFFLTRVLILCGILLKSAPSIIFCTELFSAHLNFYSRIDLKPLGASGTDDGQADAVEEVSHVLRLRENHTGLSSKSDLWLLQ